MCIFEDNLAVIHEMKMKTRLWLRNRSQIFNWFVLSYLLAFDLNEHTHTHSNTQTLKHLHKYTIDTLVHIMKLETKKKELQEEDDEEKWAKNNRKKNSRLLFHFMPHVFSFSLSLSSIQFVFSLICWFYCSNSFTFSFFVRSISIRSSFCVFCSVFCFWLAFRFTHIVMLHTTLA